MYHAAITASPFSYSKTCDTSRPRIGQCAAIRTGLGGESFVHFHIPRAMPHGLVRQHSTEGRPARIKYGLCQAGLGKSAGVDIANSNMVKGPCNLRRPLVQKVPPTTCRVGLDHLDPAPLMRPLCHCQRRFDFSIEARRRNATIIRQYRKLLQAQVDTNTVVEFTYWWVRYLDDDIEVPIAPAILRKTRPVFDFSLWQRTRIEHAEGMARKAERIAFAMQGPALKGHPTKGLPATVSQIRSPVLCTGFGKLFADGVDRSGMQPELFAAPSRQLVQVEPRQPRAPETQGILLPVVAVIPNEVHLASLLFQEPAQGFHTVTVNRKHTVILYSKSQISRGTTVSLLFPFTPRPEGWGFSERPR